MMGLGKPKLLANFEVSGFIYFGNISEVVFKRQIRFFEPPFGGVRGNVRMSSIGIIELFSLALTVETL